MPRGVYERKPTMNTYGKTRGHEWSIRRRYEDGDPIHEIAKRFKVTTKTIRTILKGDSWNVSRDGGSVAKLPRPTRDILRSHDRGGA